MQRPWGHRAAWWTVATALAVAGAVGGWLALGTGGALPLVGIVAAVVTLGSWQLRLPVRRGPTGVDLAGGLLAGTGVLAVTGLVAWAGPVGWWLTVVVAAAGWGALRRPGDRHAGPARRRSSDGGLPEPTRCPALEVLPGDPLPELSRLESVDTAQLCWAWRVSYVRIRRCTWASELAELAGVRSAYLDELQRRDPVAFARWCPTARAAGDPTRFFCPAPVTSAPARRPAGTAASSVPPPPRPPGAPPRRPEDGCHPPTHLEHSAEAPATDGREARRSPASAQAGAPVVPSAPAAPAAPEAQLHERNHVDESDQSPPGRHRA